MTPRDQKYVNSPFKKDSENTEPGTSASLDIKNKSISWRGNPMAMIAILSMVLVGVITLTFITYINNHEKRFENTFDRMEARQSAQNSGRIDRCHSVQEESNRVIEEATEAIKTIAPAVQNSAVAMKETSLVLAETQKHLEDLENIEYKNTDILKENTGILKDILEEIQETK